jgi:hypothetical protein
MSSVDRIGTATPTRQIERITDKRRNPEADRRKHREKKDSRGKDSDGRNHIIDQLA